VGKNINLLTCFGLVKTVCSYRMEIRN